MIICFNSISVDPLTDFLRWFLTPLTVADAPDAAAAAAEEGDTLDCEDLESCLAAAPLPGGREAPLPLPLLFLLVGPEGPCTGVTMYLSLRISFRRFTSFHN